MAWLIIWTQIIQNLLVGPRPQVKDSFYYLLILLDSNYNSG